MTRWVIKCTRCGTERELDLGFDLRPLKDSLYIYCPRCKMNTTHRVLGYFDPYTGSFTSIEGGIEEGEFTEMD